MKKQNGEKGFITLIVMLIAILVAVIITVYLRVKNTQ
jgi:hypothetical protein